jgi:hydrogenase expression/formation protein HypD
MKFVNEYRDVVAVQHCAEAIASIATRPWKIMEICGGQTHSIVKFGLDALLPPQISLIHGPGCPVCVTPADCIDEAILLAQSPGVIFCSFGDMLRVPGSAALRDAPNMPGMATDLLSAKASGGDVRIVHSPMDALAIAQANPDKSVVFFAVGFETTAPATAMAVYQAQQQQVTNFSILISHVLVPPAMEAILASPNCQVQGFLAAGHVCTVMGYHEYEAIATRYHVPIVVTGFEPLDIMQGIYHCVQQLEGDRAEVENQYARSVRPDGNRIAQQLIQDVFHIVPRQWRGIGTIPHSGLGLRDAYRAFDARASAHYRAVDTLSAESQQCISGEILQGMRKPHECPSFGTRCTPDHPLGAPMVSSEGACAAYYHYRHRQPVLH